MEIGRRKDGRYYPKVKAGGPTVLPSSESQRHGWKRTINKKHLATLRTLENLLLYHNFKEKLEKLNPDADIESLIDRHLEPDENLLEIKRKHPDIDIGLKSQEQTAEFRQYLDDLGISNEKVQNMIAMDPNPLSESELEQLSYVINQRPAKAVAVDNALKAPVTKDVRKWMAHPEKLDLPGVDTPSKPKE